MISASASRCSTPLTAKPLGDPAPHVAILLMTMDRLDQPGGILIRRATIDDAPALAALNRHIQTIHLAARPEYFLDSSTDEVSDWFRERLAAKDFHVWLAEAGACAAGYVVLIIHKRPATPFSPPRTFAEIDQIGVAPAFRGRGIGRTLLHRAATAARNMGITQTELSTWAFNRDAQRFFQESGFEPVTIRFRDARDADA